MHRVSMACVCKTRTALNTVSAVLDGTDRPVQKKVLKSTVGLCEEARWSSTSECICARFIQEPASLSCESNSHSTQLSQHHSCLTAQ